MQALSLTNRPYTSVSRLRTNVLPTPQVQRTLVMQPVNLKPMGNTVSLTVPADNPFAGGRRVSIHTQVSGGMAQADPSQRSRRIESRFLPMSGLGAAPVTYDEVFNWYASIDPDGKAGKPITPEKEAYWRQQVQADADKKEAAASAKSAATWSKVGDIFSTTVGAASNITSQLTQAKIAAANAAAAQAQADIERTRSSAFASRLTDVSQYGAGMAANKKITIPLLIIGGGALAVALFLFLRKKKAAAATAAA
jgi:hypothetical protein